MVSKQLCIKNFFQNAIFIFCFVCHSYFIDLILKITFFFFKSFDIKGRFFFHSIIVKFDSLLFNLNLC